MGAVVAALMVAGAAIGVIAGARDRGGEATVDAASIVAYEKAISGPAREGGFVIQEGLKIGLAQVAADQGGSVTFQAVSWVNQLENIRRQFAAAGEGLEDDGLKQAAKHFDAALVLYERTAETIGAAALTDGEPRTKLLTEAAARGRAADARYDAASSQLQRVRRAAGLPPTARFPNPAREDE